MQTNLLQKPRATVYTAVLNFQGQLDQMGDVLEQDPYKKPPQAPVLFIKPPNTWLGPGEPIPCPAGIAQLRMGGTLAAVIGHTASRVSPRVPSMDALAYVAGYTIANDVSIPHASYYRPPIAQRCRDGFCPLLLNIATLADPDDVEIRVAINGEVRAINTTRNLVRKTAQLIGDISEFLTLRAGDILLLGEPENSPLAAPGDTVRVEIASLGFLENTITPEGEA